MAAQVATVDGIAKSLGIARKLKKQAVGER